MDNQEHEQPLEGTESANGYDEMDLTPYEEDDDATLHKKLVAAKMARKRAEEDLKLLCNRIGLLKQEEGKAVRKIDETRKRANDIVYQRRRNIDANQDRQTREQNRLAEQAYRTQSNLMHKSAMHQSIVKNKMQSSAKIRDEALDTKMSKQQNRAMWEENRNMDQNKAQNIKMMIKYQQQEAATKRQMDFFDRQNRTKSQIEGKLQREAYEQNLYECEINRMEKEELDLIMRLKNTRMLEEQAHFQLESAKTDPVLPGMQSSTMSKTQAGNKSGGKASRTSQRM